MVFKIVELCSVSMLEWAFRRIPLKGQRLGRKIDYVETVAKGGNVELFRWLREEKKINCDERVSLAAVRNGHLECLKYLYEKGGCSPNAKDLVFAARDGHLNIVQYLHENTTIPWNKHTCDAAAAEGHIDIIAYARAHGCPWTSYTIALAASLG